MSEKSRQEIWSVFMEALEVFDRKNSDYGDAWRKNGWRGNLPRVFEKADRLKELLWRADPRTPAVGDEQAVDTLRDMLNSLAFTIINLREEVEYGHEIPRSQRQWHPSTDPIYAVEAPTSVVVPAHLIADHNGFMPQHTTPDPPDAEDNPRSEEKPSVRKRPVRDNPQA